MRTIVALSILAITLLTSTARSQEAPQSQPSGGGRGMWQRGPGGQGGPGGDMTAWFLRDVDENIGLSGQQKKDLQESLGKLREEAMEQFRNNPPSPEARQSFRELRQQMDQAAAAGDDEKVQELRKQMETAGPGGMFRQLRTRAMDEVSKIITGDQQEAFEQWRSLRESNLPPPLLNNPDALKESLKAIQNLSDAQKNSLEAAFSRFDTQMSAPGVADDPAQQNKIRNNLTGAIQRTLRPSQQVLMMGNFRQQMRQNRNANANQPASAASAPAASDGGTTPAPQEAAAQAPAVPAGAAPASPVDPDAWAAYVRKFVAQHHLDELATETANDILQELRTRRDVYLASHRTDKQQIERKAKLAASEEERSAVDQDRKALEQPVADMFQELKDRLDTLAPAASEPAVDTQRAVASQPATGSRPMGNRSTRLAPVASTQPVRAGK